MHKLKILFLLTLIYILTLSVGSTHANPVETTHGGKPISLPPQAELIAPGIFDLGTTVEPGTNRLLQGYAIVHYKENPAKPSQPGKPKVTQCYDFLASGAKWKTQEDWIMNPVNTHGLDQSRVLSIMSAGVGLWEDAAQDGVIDDVSRDVFGNGAETNTPLSADMNSVNGQNEVYFGSISDSGAIAVTIVWGIFSGPPQGRELVEWDMIFDQVDFDWSTSGDPNKMDFANIAVHELGHSFGLGDLYNTSCQDETMFGYASEGETKKTDLNSGDLQGIYSLYR